MKALGWLIAVSALLITVPRYTAVFAGIDDTWLTALGMGILLAGGAAYIFHAWARTKRHDSNRLLVAFGANLAYEPIIITPFIMAQLRGVELVEVMAPWYAWFWSFMVASAPVILIAGVVLAISFQREKRPQGDRKAKQAANPASYTCDVAGCAFAAKSQNGLNAHKRKHRAKGTNDGTDPVSYTHLTLPTILLV